MLTVVSSGLFRDGNEFIQSHEIVHHIYLYQTRDILRLVT